MKNQNDLIALIVSLVVTITACILLMTVWLRVPATPVPPATVAVSDAKLPTEAPVMAPSLPQPSGKPAGNGGLPGFGGQTLGAPK